MVGEGGQMHLITLGNGLRTAFVPCEAESVAFGLFIASGSRGETARTAGTQMMMLTLFWPRPISTKF